MQVSESVEKIARKRNQIRYLWVTQPRWLQVPSLGKPPTVRQLEVCTSLATSGKVDKTPTTESKMLPVTIFPTEI